MKPEFLEVAGQPSSVRSGVGRRGQLHVKNQPVVYWSDGFDKLGDPGYDGYVTERTKESSGWANMFIGGGGSSFVPERGNPARGVGDRTAQRRSSAAAAAPPTSKCPPSSSGRR
ncbi:MAG: hypothetical protein R2838_12500 [Caldilineaceae bacterium]